MNKKEKTGQDAVKLELTKKQFKLLLNLVYFGEWLVNAHRAFDRYENYSDLLHFVFARANELGFGSKFVDTEPDEVGRIYPSHQFEENPEVEKLRDEYDEETFWDELVVRLAAKEFFESYSEQEIQAMGLQEWLMKIWELENKYGEILAEKGLDAITINK